MGGHSVGNATCNLSSHLDLGGGGGVGVGGGHSHMLAAGMVLGIKMEGSFGPL